MVTILETLADFAPVTRDPDMLTEYVQAGTWQSNFKKLSEQ
jgi:flagellar biosynthesis component FlhA